MSRKHNAKHPDRNLSGYWDGGKSDYRDRYGSFSNGQQLSPDRIAGKNLFYRDAKEEKRNARKQL